MTSTDTDRIRFARSGNAVQVAGDLTIVTASHALDAGGDVFEQHAGSLQFDLGNLQRCDSAALAVLLEWRRRAARNGQQLAYCNAPARLMQLAEISELGEILELDTARVR